jgi:hypothetical protein
MNTTPAITARGPTTEEAIRHHKARRVLEILCENQSFDDLFENNFLAMSYSDRVEFYLQQCGWDPHGTPAPFGEFERCKIAFILCGPEVREPFVRAFD